MTATDDHVRIAERSSVSRCVEFRAEPAEDGLTLNGYAAVFDSWADIRDAAGTFRERIARGAFARSLGRNTPVLQFDHGGHPLIGSIPLGKITTITEDAHGLHVRARLHKNWLIEPVRDAIREGSVTGMSFRFAIPEGGETWTRVDGVDHRTITAANLFEVGPVVWPAYATTTVSVRSRQTALALTDPEVRREVAALLTLGPDDIRSLADEPPAIVDALADGPVSTVDALADGPAATPTRSPAHLRALAALL